MTQEKIRKPIGTDCLQCSHSQVCFFWNDASDALSKAIEPHGVHHKETHEALYDMKIVAGKYKAKNCPFYLHQEEEDS